ncbi:hypothetical protein [Mucilaginibacter auburnensis]|uniref:Uncharacterized protein n=1 Tax=Mucilaginibacter auburnensis TaxID=1457233 RepID=A0A2H9VV73_9SPHI|nr:hypothetical protein [Mucilaginibacter auburnensis]PJJ84689.1 hypothetical protein CLV57_1710 [Mucilaginibacter auburnensis]
MKKIIYVFGALALTCASPYVNAKALATEKTFLTTVQEQSYLAGYFTKNSKIYAVWVEDDPDGFSTVVAVYNYTDGIDEPDFYGVIEPGGWSHVTVIYDTGSVQYVGYLRATP